MNLAIVLSGTLRDTERVRPILQQADFIICADGGAAHLRAMGIVPDLLLGDFDSIAPADREWLAAQSVKTKTYPVQKDETDSEIALHLALDWLEKVSRPNAGAAEAGSRPADPPSRSGTTGRHLENHASALKQTDEGQSDPGQPSRHTLTLIAALGSRPDHVLANQLMAVACASPALTIALTDGESWLQAITGPQTATLDWATPGGQWAVSALATIGPVHGVCYEGLAYPLQDATLEPGSTVGVSNEPANLDQPVFSVSVAAGTLLLIVTPAR